MKKLIASFLPGVLVTSLLLGAMLTLETGCVVRPNYGYGYGHHHHHWGRHHHRW